MKILWRRGESAVTDLVAAFHCIQHCEFSATLLEQIGFIDAHTERCEYAYKGTKASCSVRAMISSCKARVRSQK